MTLTRLWLQHIPPKPKHCTHSQSALRDKRKPAKNNRVEPRSILHGRKNYSHPIQLEIGTNGHTPMVSCEIAAVGKYDMIIHFRWWHHEHPIKNIETQEKWCFEHPKCVEHVQDEGVADMFEWDEIVAFNEEARMIGRIGSTRQEEVQLEGLPKPYGQYKECFESAKAAMLAPRGTFDHVTDLKAGASRPWGPIYPMSDYQLEELNKYLHKMLAEWENSS